MRNLGVTILMINVLAWFSNVAVSAIVVSGNPADQGEFVSLLNTYSTGGSWSLDASNQLEFSALPTNYFAFSIYTFDAQADRDGLDITINLGNDLPGVLGGGYKGGGVQEIDLSDIGVLPSTHTTLMTKGAVLIHEVAEVFQSVLNSTDFDTAHDWALDVENSFYRSVGSDLQRLNATPFLVDPNTGQPDPLCMGFCDLYQPITINGRLGNLVWEIYSEDVLINPGLFNLGGGSTFPPLIDVTVLDQRAELAIVPIPAAFWLFGSGLIALIGFARRKKV